MENCPTNQRETIYEPLKSGKTGKNDKGPDTPRQFVGLKKLMKEEKSKIRDQQGGLVGCDLSGGKSKGPQASGNSGGSNEDESQGKNLSYRKD